MYQVRNNTLSILLFLSAAGGDASVGGTDLASTHYTVIYVMLRIAGRNADASTLPDWLVAYKLVLMRIVGIIRHRLVCRFTCPVINPASS